MSEYIKKAIETESGYEATCWVATSVYIDLKAGCAVITLEGYKDFEAKQAGKTIMGKRDVRVEGIDALSVFYSVHNTVVSAILANAEFTGGTLEQVEDTNE